MEEAVKGQVAIVTGAGQGIGRAIALRLAQDGFKVVIADLQVDKAETVAEEIRAQSGIALPLKVDLTNRADRQHLLETTLKSFDRLDVLINNAGIQMVALPLDVTEEHWDRMMDINAKAVYFTCQLALQHMVGMKSGRVVNIASAAGKLASTPYIPVYNISKAAVIAMTKTFALTYAKEGVRVNAVCPGVIETAMQDFVDNEFARVTAKTPNEIRSERLSRVPIGKVGTPEEVADVVAFLVSPDSRYMTGQAINVTGGMITF